MALLTTAALALTGAATVLTPVASATVTPAETTAMLSNIRMVSYYPTVNPWNAMWAYWYPGEIWRDMDKIQALDANTVRIIIQPWTFGYPTPAPQFVSELRQMVTMAEYHGLKVAFTLFDVWSSYTDIKGSLQWAQDLLAPYRDDPNVQFVELQAEIDPSNYYAMRWAKTLLPAIRWDIDRPVTLSVNGWDTTTKLATLITKLGWGVRPDFFEYNFYGMPEHALSIFQSAIALCQGTPLLIGETGYSTSAVNPFPNGVAQTTAAQEAYQASFFQQTEAAAAQAGLPPAGIWTFNDFDPAPNISSINQHFGLYRTDGSAKPSAAVVKAAFDAAAGIVPASTTARTSARDLRHRRNHHAARARRHRHAAGARRRRSSR